MHNNPIVITISTKVSKTDSLINIVAKKVVILDKYTVTFEGIYFWDINGGYAKTYQNDQKQNRKEAMKNSLLIVGTWLAGLGTSFLFLEDVVKHYRKIVQVGYRWIFSIELMTFLIVGCIALTAGIVLGTVLTLLIRTKLIKLT